MFSVDFGGCDGIFGVPNQVVDRHLRLSGALSLKVLLLLLRHGRPMGVAELAQLLSQNEGDVRDALNPWTEAGLVRHQGEETAVQAPQGEPVDSGEIAAVPPRVADAVPAVVAAGAKALPAAVEVAPPGEEADGQPKVRVERFRRMNRHDVNTIALEDGTVGVLMEEAQTILGRPLASGESEMLVSFYHYYGLGVDVLLMLLTYCKSIGKDRSGYIEKVAADWVNREVNTHQRAEEELLRLTQKEEEEQQLRRVFGIGDRGVTKKELEYYTSWIQDFKFDEKMIKLANERTVDAKGKLSFPYTNAILKAWHQKGIATPDAAEKETREGSGEAKGQSGTPKASYDLGKLDEMITHGSVWD